MDEISVKEFHNRTGLSVAWIHVLIQNNDSRVSYRRPGHEYLIAESSVNNFPKKKTRGGGRQKKRRNGARNGAGSS